MPDLEPQFPSLADALKGHREDYDSVFPSCECGWEQGDDSGVGPFWRDHADALWRTACTLTLAEQLDTLPAGAAVMSPGNPDKFPELGPVGAGAWIRSDDDDRPWFWWAMDYGEPSSEIGLPAVLIWHPDWERP